MGTSPLWTIFSVCCFREKSQVPSLPGCRAGSVLSLSLVPLFSCFFVFYVQHSIFSTSTFHKLCKHDDVQVYDDVQAACRRAHQRHEAFRRQGSVRRLRLVPRVRNLHRIGCGMYLFLLFRWNASCFRISLTSKPSQITSSRRGLRRLTAESSVDTTSATRSLRSVRLSTDVGRTFLFFFCVLCFAFQKDVQFESLTSLQPKQK